MDWNNDGRHDLLVGDAEGKVQVHVNGGTNRYPILSGAHSVQAGGKVLDVGERAAPVAEDWDGDGKKDLLVGSMDGRVSIYINRGTDTEPVFKTRRFLRADGEDIHISTRSAPRIYDWNGDGLKDVLIGEIKGHVYFMKNTGTNNTPVFKRAEKLFLRNGDVLRYPDQDNSARSRLFVTDWNNDGHSDILLGGRDGRIILYIADAKPSFSPLAFLNKIWNQFKESALKLKRYAGRLKEDY